MKTGIVHREATGEILPLVLEPHRSSICPRLAYFSLLFLFLFFFSSFLRVERGGRRREKDMLIVDTIIISRYRSVGTRSRKSIGTSVSSKDNWSSDKLISAASFSDGGRVIGPLSHRVGASRSCLMRMKRKRTRCRSAILAT